MAQRIQWSTEEWMSLAAAFVQSLGPTRAVPKLKELTEKINDAQTLLPLNRRRKMVSSNVYSIRDTLLDYGQKMAYKAPAEPKEVPVPRTFLSSPPPAPVSPPAPAWRIPPTNDPLHPREPIQPPATTPMSRIIERVMSQLLDERTPGFVDEVAKEVVRQLPSPPPIPAAVPWEKLEARLAAIEKTQTVLLDALGLNLDGSSKIPAPAPAQPEKAPAPPHKEEEDIAATEAAWAAVREKGNAPLVAQGSDPVPAVRGFKAVVAPIQTMTLMAFGLEDRQRDTLAELVGPRWEVSVSKSHREISHLGHYDMVVVVTKFVPDNERTKIKDNRGGRPVMFTPPGAAVSGVAEMIREWEKLQTPR